MKKLVSTVAVFLSILLTSATASAASVYIELDDSLNFNLLSGVDIVINADDPINKLNVKPYNDGTGAIPAHNFMGTGYFVSYAESYATSYGATIELIEKPSFLDNDPTAPEEMAFSPGLLTKLEHNDPFDIIKIDLLAISPSGFYNELYNVLNPTPFEDGILYKISGVPIPSSMLLLGGGLLTIFGLRRRQ